jgi:hypothetical protein
VVRAVGTGVAWEDKWIGLPCHQVGRDPQGGRSVATGMHFVGEIDSDINKTGKLFQNKGHLYLGPWSRYRKRDQ